MEHKINEPLVSIIVPVYKVKREYLIKCVNSLRNQTLKEIEIILVDDGSKDESSTLCDNFASKDSRIKVIHQDNKGVSSARNNGIRNASGKFISFVDADDWIDESMCEDAYNTAIKLNSDIVYFPNCKEFVNKTAPVYIYETDDFLVFDNKKQQFNPYNMKLLGSVWGKLYSYNLIKDLEFDESLTHGEDVEFNFRAFSKMKVGTYINKYYYHYRYINSSAVRTFRKEMVDIYSKTLVKIQKQIEDKKCKQTDIEYKAFYTFVGIIYIVICSNYIFSDSNKQSHIEKMRLLKEVNNLPIFKNGLKNIDLKSLPLTRRMPIIFAKYNILYGVYFVILVRQIQCKLYNYCKDKE